MAKQLRYLKETKSQSLVFRKSTDLKLLGFSDSDWRNLEDRKSVSGYCFIMNTNSDMVCWMSRKQACVALSTCEAEYEALVSRVQEAKFLRCLYEDLSEDKVDTVHIFVDNQSAIALAKNTVLHQRTKHIDIKYMYHFICVEVQKGYILLRYIPSEQNLADMFTKPITCKR